MDRLRRDLSAKRQRASRALTTNQPGPACTIPVSVDSSGASGTTTTILGCMHQGGIPKGLGRQRRHRLHLARIGDLDLPAAADELVPHPERAAHHLQARLHLIAQFEDEPGEPVAISRYLTRAGDLAARCEYAPLRLAIRPIESDILH